MSLDDATTADAILGRLIGALMDQKVLPPQKIQELVEAMREKK